MCSPYKPTKATACHALRSHCSRSSPSPKPGFLIGYGVFPYFRGSSTTAQRPSEPSPHFSKPLFQKTHPRPGMPLALPEELSSKLPSSFVIHPRAGWMGHSTAVLPSGSETPLVVANGDGSAHTGG